MFFVINGSVLTKSGKDIENVSFIYDNCMDCTTLGFALLKLGPLSENRHYPLETVIGSAPRIISKARQR
jgi:hypothetical protein